MKVADIIRADAQRQRENGVSVEINRSFSWVTISHPDEEGIFLQGADAEDFMLTVRKLGVMYRSLDEGTIELYVADNYTILWEG